VDLLVPVLIVALLGQTTDGESSPPSSSPSPPRPTSRTCYLARAREEITTFGKLMDPLATAAGSSRR